MGTNFFKKFRHRADARANPTLPARAVLCSVFCRTLLNSGTGAEHPSLTPRETIAFPFPDLSVTFYAIRAKKWKYRFGLRLAFLSLWCIERKWWSKWFLWDYCISTTKMKPILQPSYPVSEDKRAVGLRTAHFLPFFGKLWKGSCDVLLLTIMSTRMLGVIHQCFGWVLLDCCSFL